MRIFDELYLQALARGEPQVADDLISFFTRPVKSKLCARLRSHQGVEDGCQETLLRVLIYFRSGKTLRRPASLPAFIHSVCGNVALEMIRTHKRYNQIAEGMPDLIDSRADSEGDTLARERARILQRTLESLSDKDHELLRRVCLDEEDKDKVCQELHIGRDYLRLLLHRARLRFKALVEQTD
jgi:RNA polymerase sigma-70 factor (ECF subfamily)